MAKWIYTCSHCKYLNTRGWNMKRHIRDVHKGQAIMGGIPNNKVKSAAVVPDFSFSDRFPTTMKQGKENQDPVSQTMEKIVEIVKRTAEFKKNFEFITGNTGPRFPSWQPVPISQSSAVPSATATAPHTSRLDTTAMPAPTSSNASDILGCRYFICQRCLQPEIVPFYAHRDPKKRGGLSKHSCQANWIGYTQAQRMDSEQNVAIIFASAVELWTDGAPALFALKAEPTSFPKEFNHVNFGELIENHYICGAARNMVIRVTSPQIREFVSKTHASYCLGEFTLNGKREFYFMCLSPSKRHRNPAGLDNPRNIASGSGIAS